MRSIVSIRRSRLCFAFAASLAAGGCAASAASGGGGGVEGWMTTGDRTALLARQADLPFATAREGIASITVDPSVSFQEMEGFGYTLTGGSATVIHRLPADRRAALMRELFGRGEGEHGISWIRVSVGASDLSAEPYTYDEVPAGETDPTLARFSIDRERAELIPLLREALAINPELRVFASPWTAPTWMKDNRGFVGGSLLREHYPAFATYLVRYLRAMADEGIPIHALTVQNEPLHGGNNPSMVMTAPEQAVFIRDHLGPALREAGLAPKVLLYDHNADRPDYPLSILDDPAAKAFVAGSAFHLYAGPVEALSRVHEAHPDRGIYFTEQWTGAKGEFAGDLKWHLRNIVIGAPANWARVVMEWNLAADENHDPHTVGGCDECLGALTVDSRTGAVTRNVAYYILGHASRFVPPGSVRVASALSGGADAGLAWVAFRRPDRRLVLLVLNDGEAPRDFNFGTAGRMTTASLPAGAVATYVWGDGGG